MLSTYLREVLFRRHRHCAVLLRKSGSLWLWLAGGAGFQLRHCCLGDLELWANGSRDRSRWVTFIVMLNHELNAFSSCSWFLLQGLLFFFWVETLQMAAYLLQPHHSTCTHWPLTPTKPYSPQLWDIAVRSHSGKAPSLPFAFGDTWLHAG